MIKVETVVAEGIIEIMSAAAVVEVSSRSAGVAAEQEGEIFDTYDEQGNYLGTELRSVCHAKGIWHRAVYCFVFNSSGKLLIQKRSPNKKVGPSQWDLSVAEHLQPKESFIDGVQRGLQEELGVEIPKSNIEGPVAPMHKRQLNLHDIKVYDYEFVESYRVAGYDGPVRRTLRCCQPICGLKNACAHA